MRGLGSKYSQQMNATDPDLSPHILESYRIYSSTASNNI